MTMRFYAIRRKSDGALLPQHNRRMGFTSTEPATGCPPRLFVRQHDARIALRWWLKGVTSVIRSATSGWDSDYDYDESWQTDPVPGRSANDMEIVPVELEVG